MFCFIGQAFTEIQTETSCGQGERQAATEAPDLEVEKKKNISQDIMTLEYSTVKQLLVLSHSSVVAFSLRFNLNIEPSLSHSHAD